MLSGLLTTLGLATSSRSPLRRHRAALSLVFGALALGRLDVVALRAALGVLCPAGAPLAAVAVGAALPVGRPPVDALGVPAAEVAAHLFALLAAGLLAVPALPVLACALRTAPCLGRLAGLSVLVGVLGAAAVLAPPLLAVVRLPVGVVLVSVMHADRRARTRRRRSGRPPEIGPTPFSGRARTPRG